MDILPHCCHGWEDTDNTFLYVFRESCPDPCATRRQVGTYPWDSSVSSVGWVETEDEDRGEVLEGLEDHR